MALNPLTPDSNIPSDMSPEGIRRALLGSFSVEISEDEERKRNLQMILNGGNRHVWNIDYSKGIAWSFNQILIIPKIDPDKLEN